MVSKLAFLGLLSTAFAQYDYGTTSAAASSSSAAAPSSTSSASSSLQTIAVAKNGLTFTPNSITAKVGEKVVFQFAQAGHSVTQSSFEQPCQPVNASGINSGFSTTGTGPQSFFTVQINSTDPIWGFCAQVGHCQGGMAFVINAPSGQTIDMYQAAAKNAASSNMPANIQGGQFGTPAAAASGSGTPTGSGASSSPTTGFANMLMPDVPIFGVAASLLVFAGLLS